MLAYNTFLTIIQQGLCYALVAMGVYISYKILDFPDLTVDGSFPLGGVVAVVLINNGTNFIIAILVAMIVGLVIGSITGLLHVKFKITNLLSGILTMTALASVNLALAGKQIFVPFEQHHLFSNSFINLFGRNSEYGVILILLFIVIFFKIILDLFLHTKAGFMLRAVGNNEQMCIAMGENSGKYKIMGLAIANGMVALAGAVYSQWMNFYDNTSGIGMVVIALASVIIGTALFVNVKKIRNTTRVIIGALIYTAALNIVIALGVDSVYLKLVMAILFAIILVLNNRNMLGNRKKNVAIKGNENA